MHEEALFRQLRAALERVARSAAPRKVELARVRLGALSHLSAATLQEAWPRLVADGPAAGAQLEVDVADDPTDPRADAIVLVSVDLAPEDGVGPRTGGGSGPDRRVGEGISTTEGWR